MTRAILPLLLAVGCGEPVRLQYDHGRCYRETFAAQADLERPSAADSAYPLGGKEGLLLLEAVEEITTSPETSVEPSRQE